MVVLDQDPVEHFERWAFCDLLVVILASAFAISTAWAFQSLCSSCMASVTSPCRITVLSGLSLFHSGLESSLPKCSRNVEYPFTALGNVL